MRNSFRDSGEFLPKFKFIAFGIRRNSVRNSKNLLPELKGIPSEIQSNSFRSKERCFPECRGIPFGTLRNSFRNSEQIFPQFRNFSRDWEEFLHGFERIASGKIACIGIPSNFPEAFRTGNVQSPLKFRTEFLQILQNPDASPPNSDGIFSNSGSCYSEFQQEFL